jgi:hypothetical protein
LVEGKTAAVVADGMQKYPDIHVKADCPVLEQSVHAIG